ncbi:ATP-binding protein [Streptomyces sp. TR06-5]|uniref:ATP-binding protein n=1 Tax=unclassified Streptomyces TaxID=2593676 RepID=UPI00399F0450
MSLPLTRRIAQAALLTAAGAASVVGAAGSSSALDLQQATDLGGLSSLDTAGATDTAGDAAGSVTRLAGEAGGQALQSGMPTGELLTDAGQRVTPLAEGAVDEAVGTANGKLGDTVMQTTYGTLAMGDLQSGNLPTDSLTGQLPVDSLPTGSLLA